MSVDLRVSRVSEILKSSNVFPELAPPCDIDGAEPKSLADIIQDIDLFPALFFVVGLAFGLAGLAITGT